LGDWSDHGANTGMFGVSFSLSLHLDEYRD
jgi:hypothetical protein